MIGRVLESQVHSGGLDLHERSVDRWLGYWLSKKSVQGYAHVHSSFALFEVVLTLHDDFAGHLSYLPHHFVDMTVLDAEGPGQYAMFHVATAQPMTDAHLGAATMAPGVAVRKVEERKVVTYGDVRQHPSIPCGVESRERKISAHDQRQDLRTVGNAKDVKGCTFNIPIQYITQAEDYERIRDEDRAQVVKLKESMAWNPHSFQNTSLVYVIWADSGEHLTSADQFDPNKVYDGVYRFVCFGHQHSLTARRELHQEQPDNEAFQQIECKLHFNLQSDMVRFLADEQNSVDQNVKGKSHQQIIKSMRVGMQASKGPLHKLYWHCGITDWDVQLQDWTEDGLVKQLEKHDPRTFRLPRKPEVRKQVYERLSKGDWANVNDWQLFGGDVKSSKWFPVLSYLTSSQQMQIKAEVLQTNHISYANDYATHWSIATVRQDTWEFIVRIMHAYGEGILKGQTKTPTKGSSKKRKIWAPDSEIVDMTTETSGAEEALKDVGVDLKKKIEVG
ncbi:hypothetical protein CYMTET_8601 [Cymbomonas tetramitiformis]|uniref:Uncharacterized protein n=1 Tax=Cymbomonas tetramitiformis TaxID=36881 RepID=A0AAE0GT52_9CHLO|nr:hypothetical protein CYMTET_8601 [Cymbomonas tetramitiformis]